MRANIRATMQLTYDPAEGAKKTGMIITLTGDTDARSTELVALGFCRNPYDRPEWTKYLDLTDGDAWTGASTELFLNFALALRETLGITQITRQNF